MEPIQPSGVSGRPPEAVPPQSSEINKPLVDPIEGMFSSFQSGNKEEFMGHIEAWSKQNPGMPVELVGASLVMVGGGNPEKIAQLSQWTQEAKKLIALGGKEGAQFYNDLKAACEAGDKEAYDRLRGSSNPNIGKTVDMLGKDMLLGGEKQSFLNLTAWDGPHKVREVLASLQKPPQQKI